MRPIYLILTTLFIAISLSGFAQTEEYIRNPSFEDIPRQNHPPKGWRDCSFENESPVDVHGSETNFFGVTEFAEDGETFLGMVTRDNGTYEGVGVKLFEPMTADSTYKLTIFVNQSDTYQSISRASDQIINFDSPTRLEIWGGVMHCQMISLLEEYENIEAGIWTELTFYITPEKSFRYLGLYVRHLDEYAETNGNILLDNLQLVKVGKENLEE